MTNDRWQLIDDYFLVLVYLASYINLSDLQIGFITVEGFTVLKKWRRKQIPSHEPLKICFLYHISRRCILVMVVDPQLRYGTQYSTLGHIHHRCHRRYSSWQNVSYARKIWPLFHIGCNAFLSYAALNLLQKSFLHHIFHTENVFFQCAATNCFLLLMNNYTDHI